MSIKINILACNNNLEVPSFLRKNLDYQNIASHLNITNESSTLEIIKAHIELRFQELNF